MKKSIILGLGTILFLSIVATAQFTIKIPKLKKPEMPKANTNSESSTRMSNGKNRQMVIDDGYTFFEATPVKVYSPKLSGYVANGWTMSANLRAFGTFPDQSSFKIVVGENGKPLATYSCMGETHRKSESPVDSIKNSPDDDYMATTTGPRCGRSDEIFVKTAGKYDVQIYVVNGDNDKETLLRTYKIVVREAKLVRPGGVIGVSDFYIQRHAEAPVAMLYLRPGVGSDYVKHDYHRIKKGGTLKGNVDIYFNTAMADNSMDFEGLAYIRCSVNGNLLKFTNKGHVSHAALRSDSAKYQRDGKPTEYLGFYNYWINLPIEWRTNGADNNPNMEKLSGEWKCELRNGTETVRTFKWTVGSDGFPVEHPEQTSDNINLHWGAYLIDVEIPEGGSSMDKALMPMPKVGLFYGIPYSTEKGEKQATKVPTKGKPYLMP